MAGDAPLLRVEEVSKAFDAGPVLTSATLALKAGEIHALVGQNGSGKSTLIKILAGYLAPEPGARAWLDGEPMTLGAASAEQASRLHFIHQDHNLIPELNTLDNAALGVGYPTRFGRIDWPAHRRETAATIRGLRADIDLKRPVRELSAAQQTTVAIARAIGHWESPRSVLVLDEPTAALPEREVEKLFETIRAVAERGAAVLFVSHRLQEVLQLADRVTVLRGGAVAAAGRPLAGVDEPELIELMLGRKPEEMEPPPHSPRSDTACSVRQLAAPGLGGMSFDVHRGEIVGVAGLDGSGREVLAEAVFGATAERSGTVTVDGVEVACRPADSIAAGVGLVPADRLAKGCLPDMSVAHNVTLTDLAPVTRRWGRSVNGRLERKQVKALMEDVGLDPPVVERKVAGFSGGNQQKVVLAKWLRMESRLLVLDEPAQGVDVEAKAAIFALIAGAARRGAGILVCSAVAEDLAALCDRVIVMHGGLPTLELSGDRITADAITAEVLTTAPHA